MDLKGKVALITVSGLGGTPTGATVTPESNPEARTKAEENFKAMTALRRIGDPKEAGEVIAWLCSDAASYVTGHSMIADGGLTARFP